MKIVKAVMIVIVLLLTPVYAISSDLGYMRLSLIEGDVQIKTPEAGEWGYASINGPLQEGDQIWVPQGGRAELQLNAGTYVRLDQNSALQILSLDGDSSQFYLSQGNVYVYYKAQVRGMIQVDTPDASTRAFEKSIFRIDMSDQYTDVAVYKGYAETENLVGNKRINAGEMLSLGQDTSGEVSPMGSPDEWERWNKTRNDRIFAVRGVSSRYLPAELAEYSYDFDSSGRWVQVPDYGYVWTPTVVVGSGWSPYRKGRWIWRGGDYVWVAYEPWGWAPYHYGRWSYVARVGWCWVPPVRGEVYWGPGYVGWVRTPDYIGWVPLAPGETYYGRGDYGRHSLNITNININQVKVTNVYKNVNINNSVTIVNRNTFATASPKIANVNQNIIRQKIFVKNNISVGTPAIQPTRSSYFVSAKEIPQTKLPPQRIQNLKVKELKQSRPLIKSPEKSVLTPGIKSSPLPVKTVDTPKTPGKGKLMIKRVLPEEKAKPVLPEGGPAPKVERPLVKPEKRAVVPENGPTPKVERPLMKPEKRAVVPENGPAPKVERPLMKPEKRAVVPENGPAPKIERPLVKPEKKVVVPEGGSAPKVERPFEKPEKKSLIREGSHAPKGDTTPAEVLHNGQKKEE
jgi:hypothetical protein